MLIFQCAPLFAGLKISNLFSAGKDDLSYIIKKAAESGLKVKILAKVSGRYTLLLYNEEKLWDYIKSEEVYRFIKERGYEPDSADDLLRELAERYEDYLEGKSEFPHELGMILGYPYGDVVGFMSNKGENYLMNGYWKVYSNPEKARKIFKSYDEATEKMLRKVIRA